MSDARKLELFDELVAACRAKMAALRGDEYDPAAFDEAVLACESVLAKVDSKPKRKTKGATP